MAISSVIGNDFTTVSATSPPSFYEIYFGKDAAFMTYQNVKAEHQTFLHGTSLDMAYYHGNTNMDIHYYSTMECNDGNILSITTPNEETYLYHGNLYHWLPQYQCIISLSPTFTMSEYIL